MKKSSEKLKRLVKAQSVSKNLVKGQVMGLKTELVELEKRIALTQNAFSSTSVTLMYSDLYIGHMHKLLIRFSKVREQLEATRAQLQVETARSDKLKENLKSVAADEAREREFSENLDMLKTVFSTLNSFPQGWIAILCQN